MRVLSVSFPVPTLPNIHNSNNNYNSGGNMLTAPAATNLSGQHSSSSTSSIHSQHPPLSHENTIFSMEEQSDDSDRENNLPRFRSVSLIFEFGKLSLKMGIYTGGDLSLLNAYFLKFEIAI
uniref:Uncharacterized protein n=1 Tax=Panagrolaimus sp. PS1159 TaxID=55785 RepID=A0AC35FQI8_9BILA